jgi:AraC family transcriptional regulator of adaptative response / DNA-3-methyladenine glycosylase II
MLDFDSCYRAVSTRDARFDGQFYTAVRTTGIYCRPSCPAITPKAVNVSFFPTAAAAQQAGYRACRRCLPDAAPGSPLWNTRSDLAARAMRLIADGIVERGGVPALAAALAYSPRQLTRVLTAELGAGPLALARAHRAHTARLLIQTTALPMADIAFAAGFSSVRQFNDTIQEVFCTSPSLLRTEAARRAQAPSSSGTLVVRLPFREPYHRNWTTDHLASHAVAGMESWDGGTYRRTLRTPHGHACAAVEFHDGYLRAELTLRDMRDLAPAVARLRHLLDLDADPVGIDAALAASAGAGPVAALIRIRPGMRIFGAVDGPELLLRTMIGQQISVAAAATHTARLVAALGDPVDGPLPWLFPTAETVAARGHEVLTGPKRRIAAIVAAADAVATGKLDLHPARPAADLRVELQALAGVGPWTADYLIMRLLADPDVLLRNDLVLRRGAAALGLDLADTAAWSPWRSYLSMHLWRHALTASTPKGSR